MNEVVDTRKDRVQALENLINDLGGMQQRWEAYLKNSILNEIREFKKQNLTPAKIIMGPELERKIKSLSDVVDFSVQYRVLTIYGLHILIDYSIIGESYTICS